MYVSEQQIIEMRKSLTDSMHILLSFQDSVYKNMDLSQYGEKISKSIRTDTRVTILDKDGNVYYDSDKNFSDMENHTQRKELKDAINTGYGEDIRISKTTGDRGLYVCMPMSDGNYIRFASPLFLTYRFLDKVFPPIMIFCFFLMLAGYLLAKRLSIRLTEPFQELSASLDAMMKETPHTAPIWKKSQYEELVPIVRNIQHLNSRIVKYVRELQEKSQEIEKLENMRREFISNFSHEMKSPLTSIKGFAELLKNDMVADPEKIKKYLTIIISESTRLVNLINDILKLSEIELQQKSTLKSEKIDLRTLAENSKNLLTFQADALEVNVVIKGEASLESDLVKISEVLLNIIDNAIKYNKQGGSVIIRLRQDTEFAYISIKDTGVGIPTESLSRVFERFYRVDTSRSRKSGSTGLGLSIVKHDVGLLGGKIEIESIEGCFTEIKIKFPLFLEEPEL